MRFCKTLWTTIVLLLSITLVSAQEQCPIIVQTAVDVLAEDCTDLERNQACYGNGEIVALAQPGATLTFDAPGDVDDLADFESLQLSALDEEAGTWGVALMLVQANLPETLPGQNVTMLLFGDVQITNAGDALEAFYFRGGVGTADCAQAPDGILIQTPEDAGTVNLTVNDVQIELGSTAYLTAEAEGLLTFALLEGESTLTVDDAAVEVAGGEFTTVALDENLSAVAAPAEPQAIEGNLELPELPKDALPAYDPSDEAEDGDADSSTADAPEGVIVPRSGTWQATRGTILVSETCPPGVAQSLEANIPITTEAFTNFGGEVFDMASFLDDNLMEALPGGTVSNPEPNVHRYTYTEEGVTLVYEMRIVSETEVAFSLSFDLASAGLNCTVTVPFSAVLVE